MVTKKIKAKKVKKWRGGRGFRTTEEEREEEDGGFISLKLGMVSLNDDASEPFNFNAFLFNISKEKFIKSQQLRTLKEQADLEFNLFQESLTATATASASRSPAPPSKTFPSVPKKMLVPLMASLYVRGTLDDAEKVLVDVVTG
ncbi:putative prefoldin subunit 5 [Forsythia ovata]|uniref:Prefoldin subunit 5 n=1 Tax=Forsythia ovata TaxID=205694 RepID=A0ABD1WK44_9LAMI